MGNLKKKSKPNKEGHLSEQQVLDIIEEQPEEVQEAVANMLISEQVTYKGPIPPPSLLQQFDNIIPDGADRIMKMAEAQSGHRIEMEKLVVKANNRDSFAGVLFGGTIGVVAILGSIWLIANDKNIQGFILLIGTLASLISVYLKGNMSDKEELRDKNS
ncbi:DUF2335 domain-containing protein [Streptococcus sp. zg-JUN1979]|uniref:DUF2335 domain-containing protein n=1 Tax=Streptococcus sp. zg-JUN1979 TaxID=3391450 RepID=UPI0039A719C9